MDGMTAQARRFYHHVESGGSLSKSDIGRMVEYCEAKDAEIARLTAGLSLWISRAEQAEAREQALLSSYDDERQALIEAASLRQRLKQAEAERDVAKAALSSVRAWIAAEAEER